MAVPDKLFSIPTILQRGVDIYPELTRRWTDLQRYLQQYARDHTHTGGTDGTTLIPEWISYLVKRQSDETAHADDDFFDDGTLTGTAIAPTGTATWAEDRGLLSVKVNQVGAGDVACRLFSLTPTSPPVTVEIAMSFHMTGGDSFMGVCFTDGVEATDEFAGSGIEVFNTEYFLKENAGTITNFTIVNNNADVIDLLNTGRIYIRCVWTATDTFENSWSPDGVTWSDHAVGSFSRTMTPTHFGVYANNVGADADCIASWDYIRVTESDLSA